MSSWVEHVPLCSPSAPVARHVTEGRSDASPRTRPTIFYPPNSSIDKNNRFVDEAVALFAGSLLPEED